MGAMVLHYMAYRRASELHAVGCVYIRRMESDIIDTSIQILNANMYAYTDLERLIQSDDKE